mgnify:FL=1
MSWITWCDQLLARAQAGEVLGLWEELNKDFYQSFLYGGRWKLYLEGLGNTLVVALLALGLGLVLGMFTAMVRTFHDQQLSLIHI